jgi:hypothetical protein
MIPTRFHRLNRIHSSLLAASFCLVAQPMARAAEPANPPAAVVPGQAEPLKKPSAEGPALVPEPDAAAAPAEPGTATPVMPRAHRAAPPRSTFELAPVTPIWPHDELRMGYPLGLPRSQPRVLRFGWPEASVWRRDLPLTVSLDPRTALHPRMARLEVHTCQPARATIDGHEIPCEQGVFRWEPELPLLPGIAEMHDVRVETLAADGSWRARTVVVYLRMGLITELTFE